jgi:hypothetical protein
LSTATSSPTAMYSPAVGEQAIPTPTQTPSPNPKSPTQTASQSPVQIPLVSSGTLTQTEHTQHLKLAGHFGGAATSGRRQVIAEVRVLCIPNVMNRDQ